MAEYQLLKDYAELGTRGTTALEVEKGQASSAREGPGKELNQDGEDKAMTTECGEVHRHNIEFDDMTITAEDLGAVVTRGQRRNERRSRRSLKVSDAGTGPGSRITLDEQEGDEGIQGLLRSSKNGKGKNIDPNNEELLRVLEVKGTESTNDVSINPEIRQDQKDGLDNLITNSADIFTDKPGHTDLIEHKIVLIDST
ncbi:hypothetical protein Pmani_002345 [Petrolisthes manimaculis]|uniref:Uncharacterized protein n=2 Tax=Petrolisthes manimaculis TaxID=1843537 RepID=A0AAE1QIU1_9EUCA|nr:hypothetical protein Pmani_002345 [Petrolisthes manimaculis]